MESIQKVGNFAIHVDAENTIPIDGYENELHNVWSQKHWE